MSWEGIVGHDQIVEQFRRCLVKGRLATTFLFVGPEGVGKRSLALKLAQSMLCSRRDETELAPCGMCPDCQQVMSDTHPDLQLIAKPADRSYIPVSTFLGDRDHRARSGLCHFISLTPSGGKRRIAIIDDADWLNQEGANSLLKTLEEPSPGAVIILISTSLQRQLPTIRSRSQVIQFHPLTTRDIEHCLQELGFDAEQSGLMAARGDGSVSQAILHSDEENLEFRRDLWQVLATGIVDRHRFAKVVNEYVSVGGNDTADKRRRLRRALRVAIDFYRAVARARCSLEPSEEPDLRNHVAAFLSESEVGAEAVASLLERCIDAVRHTNSNSNLNLIVDALACDLATTLRTGQPLLNAITD